MLSKYLFKVLIEFLLKHTPRLINSMYWFLRFEEYFLVTFKSPISSPSFQLTSLGKYPLYKFLFFLFHFLGANLLFVLSGKLKNLLATSHVFFISLWLIPCPVIWKNPTLTQAFSISLFVLYAFWVSNLFYFLVLLHL